MTTDNENNDTLDDAVTAALRAVPPADAATREAHIAAALDALEVVTPDRSGAAPGRRWLAVAAAVALVAGFGLGRVGGDADSKTRNAAIEPTDTTTPPKGSTPCPSLDGGPTPDGAEVIGEYSTGEGDRTIILTDGAILIVDTATCETIETIPLP